MQGLWQEFITIFTTSSHKDLYKTLVKVCIYDGPLKLHHETWNSCKIGIEEHSRDLNKISLPESQLRESAKVSTAPQGDDSKIGPAPQQERSDRRQVPSHHPTRTKCRKACEVPRGWRAISKFARRHKESDPTRAKCREGCASDIKIRTAPPSNTHKVPRGLRSAERVASDFSPRHNESDPTRRDKRVARAHVSFFTQHCAHHETWRLKMYENVKSIQKRIFT